MLMRENIPLTPLTTLGVGGPARYFVEAKSDSEVIEAVEFARAHQLPLFILGGGSNLVIADSGFPGLVLKIGISQQGFDRSAGDLAIFTAGAGDDWDTLVARTVDAGCAGLECLSGIPGTVGGTPVQNVGAYGQEVSQTIREVRALDTREMKIRTLTNADCGFGYRSSIFNTTARGLYIILSVSYALRPGGAPSLHYADLQNFFAGRADPSLAEVRAAVREIRHRKAMLIVPGDEDARSAGSFFKNPVVTQRAFEELSSKLSGLGLELSSYPAAEGFRKLPAGWLVEHAGFARGYSKGAVGISRRHALAIINRGGATAAEIVELKNEIQFRVFEQFGVELQPEPVFVGFDR